MNGESDFSVKAKSLLRRAGLASVPMPVVVFVGVLCVALIALALAHFWPSGATDEEFSTTGGGQSQDLVSSSGAGADVASSAVSAISASVSAIEVDVEGAVKHPGVYNLAGDARVVDAVDAAGGFARNASRTSVNLAQKLQDGIQVYVATKREAASGEAASGSGASTPESTSGAVGTSAASGSSKVNINTASAEELQTLSGIGPSLSQRIIDYRESKGPFSSIEGIKEVSGIGDTRFESIKDSICV